MFIRNQTNYRYPFTIISSKGLGTSCSSYTRGIEVWPTRPLGTAQIEVFTNIGNNNIVIKDRPLKMMERTELLELRYIYNSNVSKTEDAWRLAVNKLKLPPVNNTIILVGPDGYEQTFSDPKKAEYYVSETCTAGTPVLTRENGQWELYYPATRITEYYDNNGFLIKKVNAQGHPTFYEYENNQITRIIGASEYRIRRTRMSDGVRVEILGSNKQILLHTYNLDQLGRLKSSISPNGYTVNYNYNLDTAEMGNIKQSDGTKLTFSIAGNPGKKYLKGILIGTGEIIDQKIREGSLRFDFEYRGSNEVIVYDGIKNKYFVTLDNFKRIISHTASRGYEERYIDLDKVAYDYNEKGLLELIRYLQANDENKAVEQEYGRETFKYNTMQYDFLTEHNDNGKLTKHYYRVGTRGCLITTTHTVNGKELMTHYVYDLGFDKGGREFLRFVISHEGRVTEFRPDNAGFVKFKIEYPDAKYECDTGPEKYYAVREMEDWAKKQKPDQILLEEFAHTIRGQLQLTKSYTDVDAKGAGIPNASMGFKQTLWCVDGFDYWEAQQTALDGKTTKFEESEHDQIERLTSYKLSRMNNNELHNKLIHINTGDHKKDALENKPSDGSILAMDKESLQAIIKANASETEQTRFAYTDYVLKKALAKKIIIQPNGRNETLNINSIGFAESTNAVVGQEQRNTLLRKDTNNRDIVTINPDGSNTITFYDRQNCLSYIVSPAGIVGMGFVTELRYDPLKRSVIKKSYANLIAVKDLYQSLTQVLPDCFRLQEELKKIEDKAHDRTHYEFYNKTGSLIYTVDPEGSITEHLTDEIKRDCGTIQYAAAITENELSTLLNGGGLQRDVDPTKDRCHQKYYDGDSLLIGEKDAAGYVTEYKLDYAGRTTRKTIYNTPSPKFVRGNDFNAIRPREDKEKDAITYYFNNGRKKVTHEIDPEGWLTTYDYNAAGLKSKTIRYATKVSPEWFKTDLTKPPEIKPDPEDKIIFHVYDVHNREIEQIDRFGKTIHREFDNMGNETAHREYDSQALDNKEGDYSRAHLQRYDGWSQLIANTTPFVAQKIDKATSTETKEAIWSNESNRDIFNSSGLKLASLNSFGKKTLYYYDEGSRPIIEIDPAGGTKKFTLNAFGEPVQIRHYVNRISADELKNLEGGKISGSEQITRVLKQLENVNDIIETIELDRRGLPKSKTNGEGSTTTFRYNAFGECEEETKPILQKTAKRAVKTIKNYDTRGLEIQITEMEAQLSTTTTPINEAKNNHTSTTSSLETKQQPAAIIDGLSRTTIKERKNMYGKITASIDATQARTEFGLNKLGEVISQTNALKETTLLENDAFGRVIQTIDPKGNKTNKEYKQKERTETTHFPVGGSFQTTTQNVFDEKLNVTDSVNSQSQWEHAPDGQVSKYTNPLRGVTSTVYETDGHAKIVTTPDQSPIQFQWNDARQLEQKTEAKNFKTSYTPDALGRDLKNTTPDNIVTQQLFDRNSELMQTIKDPDNSKLITTLARGVQGEILSTTQGDAKVADQFLATVQFDNLGRTQGDTIDPKTPERQDALSLVTQQKRDLMDRVILNVDANNNKTWTFHDSLGRECFVIDATGGVREQEYNIVDKISAVRVYKNAGLDLKVITENTTLQQLKNLIKTDTFDNVTKLYYDANRNERFKVTLVTNLQDKPYAIITEKRYDTANREIQTITYKKTILQSDLSNIDTAQLETWVTANKDEKDRHEYYVLDAAGNPRFTINTCGTITEKVFDSMGRVITETIYSLQEKNPESLVKLSLDEITKKVRSQANQNKDKTNYIVYNQINQIEFEIAPNGAIIKYDRLYNNNIIEECHFKNTVTEFKSYDELVLKLRALTPDFEKDRVTTHKYDAAGRRELTIGPLQNKTRFNSDALNQVTQTTDALQREWESKFDRAKRLQNEWTPLVTDEKAAHKIQTDHHYDGANNQNKQITAASSQNSCELNYQYDACNALREATLRGKLDAKRAENNTSDQVLGTISYDKQHNKVAEKNDAGEWTFHVYDSCQREIYRVDNLGHVTEYKRDAFADVVVETQYANPLTLDLSKYTNEGLPLDVLLVNLKKENENNAIKEMQYNKASKVEVVTIKAANDDKPIAIEKNQYDAFNRLVMKSVVLDEKRQANEIALYDLTDHEIATIDAAGHVKESGFNVFGELTDRIEYANCPKILPTPDITMDELKKSIVPSAYDRKYKNDYDLAGNLTKESRVDIVLQRIEQDEKTKHSKIMDATPTTLDKINAYDLVGNRISTTHENKAAEFYFYDERNKQIAKAGVPRQVLDEKGLIKTVVPLTRSKLNDLGQIIGETSYKQGAKISDGKATSEPVALDKDDRNKKFTVTQLNQTTSSIIDPEGLQIKAERKLNQGGKPIVEIDPNGNITRTIYDAIGRERFKVGPLGKTTETRYDHFDNICQQITYSKPIDIKELSDSSTETDLINKTKTILTANDKKTWFYYDADKRERFRVHSYDIANDEKNILSIEERRYNMAGHLINQVQYANKLNDIKEADLANITTKSLATKITKNENDRATYYIRNIAGQECFSIGPMGVVTQQEFDAHNNVVRKTIYSTILKDIEKFTSLSPEEFYAQVPKNPAKDRTTYTIYNAFNKALFEIAAEGNVVRYAYDVMGNEIGRTEAGTLVSVPDNYQAAVALVQTMTANPEIDRTTVKTYDDANQLIKEKNAEEHSQTFTHDIFGNQDTHTDFGGRKTSFEFDKADRLTTTTLPTKDEKGQPIKNTQQFDKAGNIEKTIEAEGTAYAREHQYEHDAYHALTTKKLVEKDSGKTTVLEAKNYNTKRQLVSEQNAEGQWTYHVYDAQNEEIYRINHLGFVTEFKRDLHADIIKELRHTVPLSFDLVQYQKQGIPLDVLQQDLKTTEQDILIANQHDKHGDIIKSEYQLNDSKMVEETQIHELNAFRETVREQKLINNQPVEQSTYLHDRNGKEIAEITPTLHVARKAMNAFKETEKLIELETALLSQVSPDIAIADFDKLLVNTSQDRKHQFVRDLLGQIKTTQQVDVVTQKIIQEDKRNKIIDEKPTIVSKSNEYSPTGKITSTTGTTGTEFKFYDATDNLIAETGVPRSSTDEKGSAITIVPLTYYIRNELGQIIEEIQFKNGTQPVTDRTQIPKPLKEDKTDYHKKLEVDQRDRLRATIIDPDKLGIKVEARYGLNNKPITEIDANGNIWRNIYDGLGHARFKISPVGAVIELIYDSFGHVSSKITYENKIGLDKLSDQTTEAELVAYTKEIKDKHDSQIWYFYGVGTMLEEKTGANIQQKIREAVNRERFSIEYIDVDIILENQPQDKKHEEKYEQKAVPANNETKKAVVNEKRYNLAGHLTRAISYYTPISADKLATATTKDIEELMKDHVNVLRDRVTYFINDSAGQACFIINPEGVVTKQKFDAFGNIVQKTIFSNKIPKPEEVANLSPELFEKKLVPDVEKDRTTYFFFNSQNKLLYNMSPNGNITRYGYDTSANLIATTQVEKQIEVPKTYEDFIKMVPIIEYNINNDRTKVNVYDEGDQLTCTHDAEGCKSEFKHDAIGNTTSIQDRLSGTTQFQYDAAKRREIVIHPAIMITKPTTSQEGAPSVMEEKVCPVDKFEFDKVGNTTAVIKGHGSDDPRTIKYGYTHSRIQSGSTIENVAIDDVSKQASFDEHKRPEQKVDVTTKKALNAKEQLLADKKESGEWTYYVNDTRGKPIYEINHLGAVKEFKRNSYGLVKKEVHYYNKITVSTGVPFTMEQVKERIVPSEQDRYLAFEHDRNGNVLSVTKNDIQYHTEQDGLQQLSPETTNEYDSFDQLVRKKERQDAKNWSEEISWPDRENNIVATLSPTRHITRKKYNAFNQENDCMEYERTQKNEKLLNPQTPISELDKNIESFPDDKNRHTGATYYLRGQKKEDIFYDVEVQEHKAHLEHKQEVKSTAETTTVTTTLSISYQYDAEEREIGKVWEDGSPQFTYRNALGEVIGFADVPRENTLEEEGHPSKILFPFIQYGINIHGQAVYTARYKMGAVKPEIDKLPTPIDKDHPENQYEFIKYGDRGLPILTHNADGEPTGNTYTAGGQLARTWHWGLTWAQVPLETKENKAHKSSQADYKNPDKPKTQFKLEATHIDEERLAYSPLGDEIEHHLYRDNQSQEITCFKHNTFRELINEGTGGENWPIYYQRDNVGNIWKSNAESYICTISLPDLAGHPTIRFQSPFNISLCTYDSIKDLFKMAEAHQVDVSMRTFDLAGRASTNTSPSLYQPRPDDPRYVPVQMQTTETKLTWAAQESSLVGKLSINPVGNPKLVYSLEIKRNGQCFEADISKCPSDQYDYLIEYRFVNTDKVVAKTTGKIQIITKAQGDTLNLLVAPGLKKKNIIELSGNTTALKSVKLLVNGVEITSVNVEGDEAKYVDLAEYPTGQYALRPVLTPAADNKLPGPQNDTVEFPVYTSHPSTKPFSREIACELKLSQDALNKVKFFLDLPDDLRGKNIRVKCDYKEAGNDKIFVHEEELKFDDKEKCYMAQFQGHIQSWDTTFLTLSIESKAITSPDTVWLQLYKNEPVLDPAHRILLNHYPLKEKATTEEKEKKEVVLVNTNTVVKLDKEDEDFEFLEKPLDDQSNAPLEEKENQSEKDGYVLVNKDVLINNNDVFAFSPKMVLYVTPVLDLDEKTQLNYKDISKGGSSKKLAYLGITKEGFLIDVTCFAPGHYPYSIEGLETIEPWKNVFSVTYGHLVFLSKDTTPSPHHQKVQRVFQHDRWSNLIEVKDSLGQSTNYKFNHRNLIIETQLPTIEYVGGRGRPTTNDGYDKRGFKVSHTDANRNPPERYQVNAAGQLLAHWESDNVCKRRYKFDAFSRIEAYLDSRGDHNKPWQFAHNKKNETVHVVSPAGNNTWFSRAYGVVFAVNHNGIIDIYDYDARGNIEKHYLPDSKSFIKMDWNRFHKKTRQVFSDGQTEVALRWEYYPNTPYLMQHFDLGNTCYNYNYNTFNWLLDSQTSQGGDHGDYLIVTKETKRIRIFDPVLQVYIDLLVDGHAINRKRDRQYLQHGYQAGRLMWTIDHAKRRRIDKQYDTEDRLTSCVVRNLDTSEVIAQRECGLNEAGKEVFSRDGLLTVKSSYDKNFNRRFLVHTFLNPDDGYKPFTKTVENKFDGSNRCIHIFEDGAEKLKIQYQDGLRNLEIKNGNTNKIDYDDDRRVSSIMDAATQTGYLLLYNVRGLVETLRSTESGNEFKQDTLYDSTRGWLNRVVYVNTSKGMTAVTDFNGFTVTGQPIVQHTNYHDGPIADDNFQNEFVGLDAYQVSKTRGQRTIREGDTGGITMAEFLIDMNNQLSATLGTENDGHPEDYVPQVNVFEILPDGQVLSKLVLPQDNKNNYSYTRNQYMHTVDGNILASYGVETKVTQKSIFKLTSDYLKQNVREMALRANQKTAFPDQLKGPRDRIRAIEVPLQEFTTIPKEFKVCSIVEAIDQNFPAQSPSSYVVAKPDQTVVDVSRELFQSDAEAETIELINGVSATEPLTQGRNLRVPQHIENRNSAGTYPRYSTFVNSIIGKMQPHLDTPVPEAPHEHQNIFKIAMSVVVAGLAFIAAPYLAPYLLAVASGTLGAIGFTGAAAAIGAAAEGSIAYSIATGVSAALADAASQEVAVKLGVQPSFSLKQSLATGVTGAFGQAFGMYDKNLALSRRMLAAGEASAAAQVTDMATGIATKFDPNLVISSMLSVLVSDKINAKNPSLESPHERFAKSILTSTTTSLTSNALYGQQPQMSLLAAQSLTTATGREAALSLADRLDTAKAMKANQSKDNSKNLNYDTNQATTRPINLDFTNVTGQQIRMANPQTRTPAIVPATPSRSPSDSNQVAQASRTINANNQSAQSRTTSISNQTVQTRSAESKSLNQVAQTSNASMQSGSVTQLRTIQTRSTSAQTSTTAAAHSLFGQAASTALTRTAVGQSFTVSAQPAASPTRPASSRSVVTPSRPVNLQTRSVSSSTSQSQTRETHVNTSLAERHAAIKSILPFDSDAIRDWKPSTMSQAEKLATLKSIGKIVERTVLDAVVPTVPTKEVIEAANSARQNSRHGLFSRETLGDMARYQRTEELAETSTASLGLGIAGLGRYALNQGAKFAGTTARVFDNVGSLFNGSSSGVRSVVRQAGEIGARETGSVAEGAANLAAKNHISRLRLQQQLKVEQASSIFNEGGGLTQEAINSARLIKPGEELGNQTLRNELLRRGGDLADWGKYSSRSISSPSGNFEMHFYHNPVTRDIYYGRDYKAVFEHQGRWNLEPGPNFSYEPPRFGN